MRILNIRFRNLNSLAGDWDIDLTSPEYEANGIFAITGPTGAGKSTILDAICLALYGRTPRLKRVNKSGNDIMTRHTDDCFAEVTFKTSQGTFRCCWSQRYSRRKNGGNLQAPQHSLFDENGSAIASSIGGVASRILELTGMDYERFTQSTLLAQGSFASFLLAAADERADLLEQITGTGLYSDISRHVFGRCKEEQERLHALNDRLGQCHTLSEEEEKAIYARNVLLEGRLSDMEAQENDLRKALEIIRSHHALSLERKQLDKDQEELHSLVESFAPERQRLEESRRALAFAGECSALAALQTEQQRDEVQAQENRELLPSARKHAKLCQQSLQDTQQRAVKEKEALSSLQVILKDVRAADTELAAKTHSLHALEASRVEALSHRAQLADSCRENENLCSRLEEQLQDAETWLRDHHNDTALVALLPSLQEQQKHMEQHALRLLERHRAIVTKEEAIASHEVHVSELRANHDRFMTERADFVRQIEDFSRERDALLEGHSPSYWRTRKDEREQRLSLLSKASEAVSLRASHLARCAEIVDAQHQEQTACEQDQHSLAELRHQHDLLSVKLEGLEESLALLEKVRGFEEERRHLADGQPCPLCGSIHHPYALGNIPAPDEKREALTRCRKERDDVDHAIRTVLVSLAGHQSKLEHLNSQEKERLTDAERCRQDLRRALSELTPALKDALAHDSSTAASIVLDANEGAVLTALLEDNDSALTVPLNVWQEQDETEQKRIVSILVRLEQLEQGINSTRTILEQTDASASGVAEKIRTCEQGLAAQHAELQHLRHEQDAEHHLLENAMQDAKLRLLPFGITVLTLEDVRPALVTLEARRNSYEAQRQNAVQLQTDMTGAAQRLAACREHLVEADKALELTTASVHAMSEECRLVRERRHLLFGDDDADVRETEATACVAALEQEQEAKRLLYDAAAKEVSDIQVRLSTLESRLAERLPSIIDREASLRTRLNAEGFADEAQCLARCLPEEKRNLLERKAAALDDATVALEARIRDHERRLTETPAAPDSSYEELEEAQNTLKDARAEALSELGALRQKLADSDAEKQRSAELIAQKEAQQKVCRRWDDLNDLIGSSDGKKYRTYAQSLTFRMLIRYANSQLAAMNDRYTLVQDQTSPLSLCVIDHYQADTVRTSRNLSGGESFLVSLSLALGLARMASRSVSVDSVFLDEGFGTLDDDALNMALDMLSNLRQQGKTIGLISHVAAIRERIGVRIQVEPDGSGRSRLIGPGITRPKR